MSEAAMDRSESEQRSLLSGPAGDWVERAGTAAGDHPGVEELIAYHHGNLPEDGQRRVQDHLVTCSQCLDHLLELDAFSRPETDPEGRVGGATGAADFETAAAWRALRPRLPSAPARLPRWAAVLAASLSLAVLGLALWSLAQRHEVTALSQRLAEISRPQPGVAIVDLYPPSAVRRDGVAPPVVELPAGAGYATLVINLPAGGRQAGYEVEILDSEGHLLWSGGGLEASRFGTLRLGLPGGFLPPGEHSLRLYGRAGEERHWIETYPIRVPEP